MNIQEAVKEAGKQKRGITRKLWGPNPIWIIPTNTTSGMILANRKDELVAKWNPISQDITATD
ncbi:Thoeris anti-defense Tad2 family protein [Pediococcus pentosaceus]|uniref:Thoeris anti-defense Tad2 family protein n=1 Tax=Pediococcus pentosaceus TaxID=1255 RepID=UPI002570CDD7|nr:hypothetical protein [Pediococcus pentosaceus]